MKASGLRSVMNERTEVGFEMCKACIRISLCLMFVSGLMLGRSTASHAQSATYIPFVAGAGESPTIELTISGNVKLNFVVDTGGVMAAAGGGDGRAISIGISGGALAGGVTDGASLSPWLAKFLTMP